MTDEQYVNKGQAIRLFVHLLCHQALSSVERNMNMPCSRAVALSDSHRRSGPYLDVLHTTKLWRCEKVC